MRLPPIAWGVLAGLAVAAALAMPTSTALGRLDAARAERDALAVIAAGQTPAAEVVSPDWAIAGRAPAVRLAQRLRGEADRGGLLVEELAPRDGGALARVRLRVSGSPDAVLAFVDAIERGRPLVRFAQWRIEAAGGAVRWTGEAVAPWR